MKLSRVNLGLGLGLLTASIAAGLVMTVQAPAEVQATDLPLELQGQEQQFIRLNCPADLSGIVSYDLAGKSVNIQWRLFDAVNKVVHAQEPQKITLSYFPTAISKLSDSQLIVAGKSKRGQTIVELYGIDPPTTASSADPLSGAITYTIHVSAVRSIDEVLRTIDPEFDVVASVTRTLDDAKGILCYFWSSRVIERFNVETGVHTRWASPQAGGGALVVPDLSSKYIMLWGREHVSLGFVYCLFGGTVPYGYTPPNTLMIKDTDKNGTADTAETVTATQWSTQYIDAALWK